MNYYNDNDPKACAWLRELIAAGHLPAGTVDERSICDVRPDELRGFDQCHFFAGIGGWPLALRWAGLEGAAGIWTGSCPCQPLSCAGKRQGHADERHLWPAFHALIAERRPATVFGEQVASKDGREWFAGVRLDLEELGYACGGADLCAAGEGALHIRQRLWWVADSNGLRPQRQRKTEAQSWTWEQLERLVQAEAQLAIPSGKDRALADGIPGRMGLLRGYGNAIVPQVAAEFVTAWQEARSCGEG